MRTCVSYVMRGRRSYGVEIGVDICKTGTPGQIHITDLPLILISFLIVIFFFKFGNDSSGTISPHLDI